MASETITRNDLQAILNEVLPSSSMVKTVAYNNAQITWYSTSNPFYEISTDITLDGWTPIDLTYQVVGTGSSFVSASAVGITNNGSADYAHGYFRMVNSTPSSTTQNTVNWEVTYIKNAPMVAPMADYIVKQGTSGIWTYRKWNSGIAECWGKYTGTVTLTTFATYYHRGYFTDIAYPSGLFTSAPCVNGTVNNTTMWTAINSASASVISYLYVYDIVNSTSASVRIDLHAIGRWK